MSRQTFQERYETNFPKMLKHYSRYPYNVRSKEEMEERLNLLPEYSRRLIEVRWKISQESEWFDVYEMCQMLQMPYGHARNDFIDSKYLLYFIEPENVPFDMAAKLGKMLYACYRCKKTDFDKDLYHKVDFYELLEYVYKMDSKYRYIIIKHYGLDGNVPLTFEELAESVETSVSYVKILEKKAFDILRLISHRYSQIEGDGFCELADLVFYGKLTPRAYNALRRNGVKTIRRMKKYTMSQLLSLDGIGHTVCEEILRAQKDI